MEEEVEGWGEAVLQSPWIPKAFRLQFQSTCILTVSSLKWAFIPCNSRHPTTALHQLMCFSMSGSHRILLSFLVKVPLNESDFTVAETAGPSHGLPSCSPHSSQRDVFKIQT